MDDDGGGEKTGRKVSKCIYGVHELTSVHLIMLAYISRTFGQSATKLADPPIDDLELLMMVRSKDEHILIAQTK